MKFDILLSAIVHAVLILATVVSSPFDSKSKFDYDEVIRVSLTAAPMPAKPEPVAITPPSTPQAVEEELPDIPVTDPTTEPPVEIPDKPKPDKEEKKEAAKPPANKQPTESETKADKGTIDSPQTSAGSPFAGATIDNESFDYPYWFTQAFNKIRTNWRNPVSIGYTVTCTINFQVIKSGRLVKAEIVESSGIAQFDQACLNSIERSAPFPPLPRDFTDEIIGITLPFQYKP